MAIAEAIDPVVHVALDRGKTNQSVLLGPQRADNADVVRRAVLIQVKEDQVARDGLIIRIKVPLAVPVCDAAVVHAALVERLDPAPGLFLHRHRTFGNVGVMQAEGGKHRAPIAVIVAVPVAVAGIAHASAIDDNIVDFAFTDADLALRDPHQILRPVAAKILQRHTALPLPALLHAAVVGVAVFVVLMLLLVADELLFIADLGVLVALCHALALLLAADQHQLRFIAALVVRVAGVIAVRLALLLAADQHQLRFIAALVVRVAGVDLHLALRQLADQVQLVTFLGVRMLLKSAIGGRGDREGGQDQRIGRNGYDNSRKDAEKPLPASVSNMTDQHPCLLLESVIHLLLRSLPTGAKNYLKDRNSSGGLSGLFNSSQLVKGPDAKNDLADDLLLRHTADD